MSTYIFDPVIQLFELSSRNIVLTHVTVADRKLRFNVATKYHHELEVGENDSHAEGRPRAE
jgi:hypothetical protein